VIPEKIDLDESEERLLWDWSGNIDPNRKGLRNEEGIPEVEPKKGLLREFAKLADASPVRIRNFARKWGVLEICEEHNLPCTHNLDPNPILFLLAERNRGTVTQTRCQVPFYEGEGYERWEPIEIWRKLSRQANAFLNLTAEYLGGRLGRPEDWEILTGRPQDVKRRQPSDPQQVEDTHELIEETHFFSGLVMQWLYWGDVRPNYYWGEKGPTIHFGGSRLFGALATQLMLVAGNTPGVYRCNGCNTLVSPKRKPRIDRRNYCPRCRREKIPQRDAKRDYLERQRAKKN